MSYEWVPTPQSDPYEALLNAIGRSAVPAVGGVEAGAGPGTGGLGSTMPGQITGFSPGQSTSLNRGWLNHMHSATSPEAGSFINKMKLAGGVQNPIVEALIGALSPIPGLGSLASNIGQAWQNDNLDLDQALGLVPDWYTGLDSEQAPDGSVHMAPSWGQMNSSRHGAGYGPGRRAIQGAGSMGPMAGGIKMRRRPTHGGAAAVQGSGVDKKRKK